MVATAYTVMLHRADGPLYRQAAQRLRAAIAGGALPVGSELPTEAELAQGFGISLITIRAALRELEGEGLIRKRAAKTALVTSPAPRDAPVRQINSLDDLAAVAAGGTLEIASFGPARSAQAAHVFGLDGRVRLPCLRARMVRSDGPHADVAIFFPPEIGRRLTRADFDDVVVFRTVERRLGIRVAGARVTVSARTADAALAARLDCAVGDAILTSRIVYCDAAGVAVEMAQVDHRADRFSLSYDFRDG